MSPRPLRLLPLVLGVLLLGCVTDPYGDPLPDHAVTIVLRPGVPPARGRWPIAFRRGAEFVIENRSGRDLETLLVDFSRRPGPRELAEVTITDPPGHTATILPAPHGTWPLRARLGRPGSVLVAAGEALHLTVRVAGTPGQGNLIVTAPGVTKD